jgi:LCP family protein required for cell wall assembly
VSSEGPEPIPDRPQQPEQGGATEHPAEQSPEQPAEQSAEQSAEHPGAHPAPHPRRRRRRRILAWTAGTLALIIVVVTGAVWYAYNRFSGNIKAGSTTEKLLGPPQARPTVAAGAEHAENILLSGSDNRDGANAQYGDAGSGARSDTTILLHLSADRRHVTAVSIPRDTMVRIPACQLPDGKHTLPEHAQFNWAYSNGGTACTIRTVEQATGIRIDHFMVVDFTGFKKMVDAMGGVDVCLSQPVNDKDAKLNLPAGRQHLDGTQALGFVRVRYSLGDGTDTERIGRQQEFLSSLVQSAENTGVLLNPTKLIPLLDAATSALTVDPGLDSLEKLYSLARSLKSTSAGQTVFITAPVEQYPPDPNRLQFTEPAATDLWNELRNDQPVTPAAVAGATASGSASASASTSASASASGSISASTSGMLSPTRGAQGVSDTASPSVSGTPSPSPSAYSGRVANQDICGK